MKIIQKKKINSPPNTVGEILKYNREKAHYSQEELARFFDGDVEKIEAWEADVIEPTVTECMILSKLYAVSIEDMFRSVDVLTKVSKTQRSEFEQAVSINRLANRWFA